MQHLHGMRACMCCMACVHTKRQKEDAKAAAEAIAVGAYKIATYQPSFM